MFLFFIGLFAYTVLRMPSAMGMDEVTLLVNDSCRSVLKYDATSVIGVRKIDFARAVLFDHIQNVFLTDTRRPCFKITYKVHHTIQ